MLVADLDLAARALAAFPPPGTLLQCGVTGAHHYGFPSEDSDIDLKGIHLAPTRALLGLDRPKETHDKLAVFEGVEVDITTHEAGKALSLLLSGNGNVLERLWTPLQVVESDDAEALRALGRAAPSRKFARHYAGYFRGMCREHEQRDAPRAKTLLYVYRVALTGIHLLRTGEVRADVAANAEEYGFPGVEDLIASKRANGEKSALDPVLDEEHRARWPALAEALAAAEAESALPPEVPNRDAIDAYLVERRVRDI